MVATSVNFILLCACIFGNLAVGHLKYSYYNNNDEETQDQSQNDAMVFRNQTLRRTYGGSSRNRYSSAASVISCYHCNIFLAGGGRTGPPPPQNDGSAYKVVVSNKCRTTIWVRGKSVDPPTFRLEDGAQRELRVVPPQQPRPRLEARFNCQPDGNRCDADGDIVSLAEWNWDESGKLWYDVSMVDGFNMPVVMWPTNPGQPRECTTAACTGFIIGQHCPNENRLYSNDGRVVACQQESVRHRDWETNYSRSMNRFCPDAYGWSKDDQRRPSPARFSCNPNSGNNIINVQFC